MDGALLHSWMDVLVIWSRAKRFEWACALLRPRVRAQAAGRRSRRLPRFNQPSPPLPLPLPLAIIRSRAPRVAEDRRVLQNDAHAALVGRALDSKRNELAAAHLFVFAALDLPPLAAPPLCVC